MSNTTTKTELSVSPLSEYQYREFTQAANLAKKISEFYPAEAKARYSEYDGSKHFEGADVFLVHPTLKIRATFDERRKKYSFYNQSENDLKNMTYYSRSDAAKGIDMPKQIGVLTTKKIEQWVKYYETTFEAMQIKNNQHSDEIQAFRDSIKDLKVDWNSKDRKGGRIVINGIRFRFEIGETYVSTWTEIDYSVPSGLKSFLQLSDNKFKSPK